MAQTLAEIRRLLAERGLSPRKALGQNFLIDGNLVRKLADESGVRPGDLVLEVGPGTGVLTEELLGRGCVVVACELDRGLAALLRETLAPRFAGTLTLIEGDCLESKRRLSADIERALGSERFRLVANLPYGAATPLLLALLIDHPRCTGLYVTVQREVADRVLAGPGSKDYGTLGVVAAAMATTRRIATLPPECFWPRPEVTSAMIAVERRATPLTDDPRGLAEFCTRVFSKRRKQLGSVLGRSFPWPAGVHPDDRAEDLSVDRLIALSRAAGSV